MAHDAEAAGFGFHARFAGVPVDQSARNEVEYLLENDHIGPGWCFVVHTPYRVAGISAQHQPFFSSSVKLFYGTAVKNFPSCELVRWQIVFEKRKCRDSNAVFDCICQAQSPLAHARGPRSPTDPKNPPDKTRCFHFSDQECTQSVAPP
jgi:hypothetical protein